jgi:peptidoglycan/LPS O-acetylase OafA/YrhL
MTWSISTEWFFYLIYPGIAWLVLRPRSPRLTFILALLWCILWAAIASGLYDRSAQIDAWALRHFGPNAAMLEHQQDSFVRWLLYYSPYLRVGEFVLGTFMAQLYVGLRERPVTERENAIGAAVFLAAAASVILVTYLEYSPDVGVNIFRRTNMNFALAPAAALLIFCGARYDSPAARLLTSRPAIVLGEASYSIYLVHPVVLVTALKLTGAAVHGIAYDLVKLVLLIAVVLLISLVLYAYYEAPARRWLRERRGGRLSRAALAQAPRS